MSASLDLVEPLVARWHLEPPAAERLSALLEVLDDRTAPTTVRRPAEAADAHLADSLVALELDAVRAARHIADLGSGAGFPGLALAVARPRARVSLVESVSIMRSSLNSTKRGIKVTWPGSSMVAIVRPKRTFLKRKSKRANP